MCVLARYSAVRDGARTLLKDAKAGVDAVGASWQSSREESGSHKFASAPRGWRQEDADDHGEFEVTLNAAAIVQSIYADRVGSVLRTMYPSLRG